MYCSDTTFWIGTGTFWTFYILEYRIGGLYKCITCTKYSTSMHTSIGIRYVYFTHSDLLVVSYKYLFIIIVTSKIKLFNLHVNVKFVHIRISISMF